MSQPVILVIDGDAGVTAALREDLDRRFGEDFHVIGESSADSGLAARFISRIFLYHLLEKLLPEPNL